VWNPEEVADHSGVTATFDAPLAPTLTVVPDALVGRCWPAVFAAIGAAATDTGFPVVEEWRVADRVFLALRATSAQPAQRGLQLV
jgi:hypothetical protein